MPRRCRRHVRSVLGRLRAHGMHMRRRRFQDGRRLREGCGEHGGRTTWRGRITEAPTPPRAWPSHATPTTSTGTAMRTTAAKQAASARPTAPAMRAPTPPHGGRLLRCQRHLHGFSVDGAASNGGYAEARAWPMADGTCAASDASACTACTCNADDFKTDGDASNGCGGRCPSVANGSCTPCPDASTCRQAQATPTASARTATRDGRGFLSVADGTRTAGSDAPTRTAITGDADHFSIDADASNGDGCEGLPERCQRHLRGLFLRLHVHGPCEVLARRGHSQDPRGSWKGPRWRT